VSGGFRRQRAVPQEREARAQRALDRTAAMLKAYRGNGLTVISIEDVLTLLGSDPDTVPERREGPRDPRTDPLTGALWAGPPGSMPPAG
jgi:hypothetical protein